MRTGITVAQNFVDIFELYNMVYPLNDLWTKKLLFRMQYHWHNSYTWGIFFRHVGAWKSNHVVVLRSYTGEERLIVYYPNFN